MPVHKASFRDLPSVARAVPYERWVRAVRRGMTAFGKSWTDLRGDRSDYDVLENIPALEAPVFGSDSDSDD